MTSWTISCHFFSQHNATPRQETPEPPKDGQDAVSPETDEELQEEPEDDILYDFLSLLLANMMQSLAKRCQCRLLENLIGCGMGVTNFRQFS